MALKTYLLSLPERLARSVVGLGAGLAREVGEVAIPAGVRRSRLYQSLVDTTLRFLIERVGGVEGVYSTDGTLASDFFVRRTAGNAIEALGIVAFRASPVWVLAALADVCGLGRSLIPEISAALKERRLLEPDVTFTSADELLDGLERMSGRLAETFNTPPLDVATLRQEWAVVREAARGIGPGGLPSRETLTALWTDLRSEAARQERSVFETSSMIALSAVKSLPDGARWLGASAAVGAGRTGRVLAQSLLEHYRTTLNEVRHVGYLSYATQQLSPYLRAAVAHLAPERITLTERLLEGKSGESR